MVVKPVVMYRIATATVGNFDATPWGVLPSNEEEVSLS